MNVIRIRVEGKGDPYDRWIEIGLTGRFSGSTGFYDTPRCFAAFADSLSAYPIDPNRPPRFEGGNVDLVVTPADARGNLYLDVRLIEYFDGRDSVTARVPLTYGDVQEFQRKLRAFIASPEAGLQFEIR